MRNIFRNLAIILTLVLTVGCSNTASFGRPLKFVQITDDHLTFTRPDNTHKMLGHSAKLLEDAIEQINQERDIKFVMFTGDSIDAPSEEDANKFISMANKLRYPWYLAFGNHDIAIFGKLTKDKYLEILNNGNNNFDFQKSYYSFCPQRGYKVIALDAIDVSKITANGYLPKEELDWLDKEIKNSPNDVILIFMHHPLVEPFESKSHRISNADEFSAILNKYKNPMAVISGHYHGSKITQCKNILHISSPALVSYPNAFRVITVKNEGNKAVFNIEWRETSLQEVQFSAKVRNLGAPRLAGEDKDKQGTFVIETK